MRLPSKMVCLAAALLPLLSCAPGERERTEAQVRPVSAAAPPYRFSPGSDQTGKGAVVCAWWIYVGVQQTGEECFPGKDEAFKSELSRSITRIDSFIIRNNSTPVTQMQLDASKQEQQQSNKQFDFCSGDGSTMYKMMSSAGPMALRESVDELLSIPREPVADPCL